jgi:small subunit ribosomal protein S1
VSKIKTPILESAPPALDESWWASLLANEEPVEGSSSAAHHPRSKPAAEPVEQVDWDNILQIFRKDEVIQAQVTGYNQGGLLVESEGLQGFVPISHLLEASAEENGRANASFESLKPVLSTYVGQCLHLKVIECDPARGRVVLSERAAQAAPGRRNQLLSLLKNGERVWGTVTNITDFGVFVDLGGLEGLIHISELSWGRVRHPADMLKLGDSVEVFVIQSDRDRCRVALSLKRLIPNPWETADMRYHIGQVISARVTSIVSYGAFARVEEGLDGLIHVSEMGPAGATLDPSKIIREGQQVSARIVHIDTAKQRLGLSLLLED